MDPLILAAAVVLFVQGIKEVLKKAKIDVSGVLAIILTVLVSAGEVASGILGAGQAIFTFAVLWLFVKVTVYALGGYGLVKVASGNNVTPGTPPNPVPLPPSI
jgi:hypothetical protein